MFSCYLNLVDSINFGKKRIRVKHDMLEVLSDKVFVEQDFHFSFFEGFHHDLFVIGEEEEAWRLAITCLEVVHSIHVKVRDKRLKNVAFIYVISSNVSKNFRSIFMHSDKMFLFGAVSFDTVILKNFMEVSRMKLVLCLIIAVGPDFIKL
tara:strand:- start:671 stop:1120 length:450 start_codon:yes stop_codon:yes gene_type:complete